MTRIVALVATIPARRGSCERMLRELAAQSRPPDEVVLILDGYGDAPPPPCPLPSRTYRTAALSGCGVRWRLIEGCDPTDILICVDDDYTFIEAPHALRALADAVERGGGAAAAFGLDLRGKRAMVGDLSRGDLLFGGGCGLSIRAEHVPGILALNAEIIAAGGPDALGLYGPDDALVSAYCWKRGIRLLHAATGNIFAALGTRATSQTAAMLKRNPDLHAQKRAIRKITGWPWPNL